MKDTTGRAKNIPVYFEGSNLSIFGVENKYENMITKYIYWTVKSHWNNLPILSLHIIRENYRSPLCREFRYI